MSMTRRSLLVAAPACGLATFSTTGGASADLALLDLGRRFEAAFAAEEAARMIGRETDDWSAWDKAYAVTEAIVREIEVVPANSLEGFRVKARCVQWCYGDDPVFHDMDRQTTDVMIAQQIVRDLLEVAS